MTVVSSNISADFSALATGLRIDNLGSAVTIHATQGVDFLSGGAGTDVIDGADSMRGGARADYFAYRSLAEVREVGTTYDRILDFDARQGDKIDQSAIDADAAKIGTQTFTFIGTAAFTGSADRYEFRAIDRGNGDCALAFDTNHNRKPDIAFSVHSDSGVLTPDDFVLGGAEVFRLDTPPAAAFERTTIMSAFVQDNHAPQTTFDYHLLPMSPVDGVCIV